MHKRNVAIIAIFFSIYTLIFTVYAKEPVLQSPSSILIDNNTGRILYKKNIHQRMYPASITKIMTAILALENGNLNDTVTASQEAIFSIEPGSSHIGILPGEQLTLEQLLYGLLIASANEGANIIAEHIAGNIDEFVVLMNKRALELGAKNTHFANPHGFHDDNHYTTAYDMSLIARHAMTFPKFREIVKTVTYEIPATEKSKKIRTLANTNHLINKFRATRYYNYFYPAAIGIKTGYTSNANHTLVASAVKNNLELISVVLGAEYTGNKCYNYEDTISLFNYGFNNFSIQTVVDSNDIIEEIKIKDAKNNEHVILMAEQPLKALLPKNIDYEKLTKEILPNNNIVAPIKKNDVMGIATYKYNGQELGKVKLISDRNVEIALLALYRNAMLDLIGSLWFKILLGIVTAFILFIFILKIIASKKRKRERNYSFVRKNKARYIHRSKKW